MNIYLCGKAGVGKSVAAAYLTKKYNLTTAKFAYPVYNLAYNYFKMEGKDRKLLQVIGSDVGRDMVNSEIWVNRFQEDITIIENTAKIIGLPPVNFILDDCRFKNEHEMLKKMGWVGIYLHAPDTIRLKRLEARDGTAQESTLNHPSELAIDTFKDELVRVDASVDLDSMLRVLDNLMFVIS